MDWKKLLYPPVWLLIILTAVSAGGLTLVFVKGWERTAFAYGLYALAFYTLCALCLFLLTVFPRRCAQLRRRLYGYPLTRRYLTNSAFRDKVSLELALAISLLYMVVNLWFWYQSHSWWFVVLAAYYLILATIRLLLTRYVRNEGKSLSAQWRCARSCAYILLLVNLCLSGAVLMILYRQRGYDYPGVLIYVMALYTFYSTTHAVVDLVRCRRLVSPVMSAAKVVGLSAALVSMLNLETAMFAQFGRDMSVEDRNLMIMLTGAGISMVIVTLSVALIVDATRALRGEKDGK